MQSAVENALAHLILRLGGLRVGILGEDTNKACFVRVPSMNLQDFIEWKTVTSSSPAQHDEEVLQAIQNRLEQLWPDVPNRPPWKLLVVQKDSSTSDDIVLDIVFTVHHAIADGKSTGVFHSQLLRELNAHSGAPPELRDHVLTFTQPPVLAPSQEDLVHLKLSWPFFLTNLWNELGPSWLKPTPPPAPWTGKHIVIEPHKLNLRLVTIEPDTVRSLVAACRAHGTTLSGILHVLVLTALARRVPPDVASLFAGSTPISLLPWARLPPGVNVDLTSVLTVLTTGTQTVWGADTVDRLRLGPTRRCAEGTAAEDKLLWPVARRWREEIKAKVATLPGNDVVGLLGYISDFEKYWMAKVGKPRDSTWELSNIGSIKGNTGDGEGSGAWSIRRSLFSQPIVVASSAICINVAGLDGGPVNLVLSWQETVIDNAIVDGVAQDLRAWFKTFRDIGSFGIFHGANKN